MSTPNMSILKETEVGSRVVCLLKIYDTYFVRILTGKEGIVENLFKGTDLKEAEKFFEEQIIS